jgi:hypothetical protein
VKVETGLNLFGKSVQWQTFVNTGFLRAVTFLDDVRCYKPVKQNPHRGDS